MATIYRTPIPVVSLIVNCSDCRPFSSLNPPPPIVFNSEKVTLQFSPVIFIVFAIITVAFLLLAYYAFIMKYRASRNRSRIIPPEPDTVQEDFFDEDQGPVVDHPIWYIRTVGLPDNIINSINVFKYQKGAGLVEGTDCSVCLGEFQEDETLRLLPKCSHAFHLPCIDTWLRSHTNCPLCRAPILCNSAGAGCALTATETNSSNSGTIGETQLQNSARDGASGSNQSGEDRLSDAGVEVEPGTEDEVDIRIDDGTRYTETEKETITSALQVLGSDLGVDRQEGEGNIEPVRRSFSMGSIAAAMICFSLANIPPSASEGSSSTQVVPVKKSNSGLVVKSRGVSTSIFKLMSSSFTRQALKAGPIAMKRSVSCSGKSLFSRYGGTKNSILPL
ncbi:hypothetical protein NE237_018519 [Protea cynaroides]|uniref:RING-type E3 ubiquitin transferase n=1 Tax=Protea cynaroides TaxID=273540 RepID=A0A9Q0QP04_9MAGN|nr:hypothetical protein NE237_018519 [Protea cynaroides]